ncbi:hypothetical protein [Microbacterium sp.]|uniref:hypothetical protein n=1 Tax=Microbacterium sp. TaxID=51671 RepID=UPI0039E3F8C5
MTTATEPAEAEAEAEPTEPAAPDNAVTLTITFEDNGNPAPAVDASRRLTVTTPLGDLARTNPAEFARQQAEIVERTLAVVLKALPSMEEA